ncbi:MAG: hypothetical protein NC208_09315, partial [Bacteroides sp.]|nr:hypothetical protein [Bacteroides sp.]
MAVATLEQTQPSLLGKGDALQIQFGAAYHIPCHAFVSINLIHKQIRRRNGPNQVRIVQSTEMTDRAGG